MNDERRVDGPIGFDPTPDEAAKLLRLIENGEMKDVGSLEPFDKKRPDG